VREREPERGNKREGEKETKSKREGVKERERKREREREPALPTNLVRLGGRLLPTCVCVCVSITHLCKR